MHGEGEDNKTKVLKFFFYITPAKVNKVNVTRKRSGRVGLSLPLIWCPAVGTHTVRQRFGWLQIIFGGQQKSLVKWH